jgi:hypothetical protein
MSTTPADVVFPDLYDVPTVKSAESEVGIAAVIDIIEDFPVKPPLTYQYIALEGTKACQRKIFLIAVAIITTSVGAISRLSMSSTCSLFASSPFRPLERELRH